MGLKESLEVVVRESPISEKQINKKNIPSTQNPLYSGREATFDMTFKLQS